MHKEILINNTYTSIVETADSIECIDLRYYNQRERELISFHPQTRKRVVKTEDFYNRLLVNFKQNDEILPSGCKFYKRVGNNHKVLVIEEPPRIRTILVDTGIEQMIEKLRMTGKLKQYGFEDYKPSRGKEAGGYYSFQLSFPYVVFMISLDQHNNLRRMKPFFRLHSLTSMSDYLLRAPLYNIPQNQSMCMGSVECYQDSLIRTTENIIEKFWFNIYNHDYSTNIVAYQETDQYEVHDYLSWMYFSQIDPMFIYNIKWIKWDHNVGSVINHMTREAGGESSRNGNMFKLLYDSTLESSSSSENIDIEEKNISESMIIDDDILSIGDELLYQGLKVYLYSIVGNLNGITTVELEYENGNIISVPYDDFEEGYATVFTPVFLESANVNNKVIKPNDVVEFNIDGVKMYKKIKNLRIAKDGKIEAYIGNDHYLIENINFNVVNLDHIEIEGQKLIEGKVYNILSQVESYGPVFKISRANFDTININNRGEIILKFKNPRTGSTTNVSYDKYKSKTSEYTFMADNTTEEPAACFYFDRLLVNDPGKKRDYNEFFEIAKGKGIITHESNLRAFVSDSTRHSQTFILDKILFDSGTRLHLPGLSANLDFKVGDPIVYANWMNPEDMLSVAGIESFSVKDHILYANAKVIKGDKVFQIPLLNTSNCKVNIGVMTKVFSKCGDWMVGDKIKAKVAGVFGYPKKDTNAIIAFINVPDTKYPVALLSNLCTIWMNEKTMAAFDRIPVKSPKWAKLEVTPFDVEKIRWQHGDFFKRVTMDRMVKPNGFDNLNDGICFLTKRGGTQYGFDYSCTSSWGHIEYGSMISKNTLVERKIRHGILMPRFQITKLEMSATMPGYPNMFGGFYTDVGSRIIMKSDQILEGF